jgi:hypothetical protein
MTEALALDGNQREVRLSIYRTFADEGRAPSVAELVKRTGIVEVDVRAALQFLHEIHAIVLTEPADAIRLAHPFSSAPMGFVVSAAGTGPTGYDGDRLWWGGCAWDSFGIGAALAEPIVIRTRCPACSTCLVIPSGPTSPPDEKLVVHIPLAANRWWDDVVRTCSNIRLFCSPDHVEAWARTGARTIGQVVPARTMWRLAQPWYGDRLSPNWSRRSSVEGQEILNQVGLTGRFWSLG